MVRVRLLYFAVLRDITGSTTAEIDLPNGSYAAYVWDRLLDAATSSEALEAIRSGDELTTD